MDRPPPNRVPRRAGSGRFPIKVSISSSPITEPDSASGTPAPLPRIPLPPPPPSIPPRSQYRQEVHQNGTAAARRPAVTPLFIGNERHRSNSEGLVQANKTKRMGIISRKASELGTVDEARISRYSHYRGLSHGSFMQDKHLSGVGRDAEPDSSPVSPTERGRPREQYIRRLASVPEHKDESVTSEKKIEGIKGILYSLSMVLPHVSPLIAILRDEGGKSKRSSLEFVFHNASAHVEELDREIYRHTKFPEEDEAGQAQSLEAVEKKCVTAIMAYQHVGSLLLRASRKLVETGDARYVRTLSLLLHGSLMEVSNACKTLRIGGEGRRPIQASTAEKASQVSQISQPPRDGSVTPTQGRLNAMPSMPLRNIFRRAKALNPEEGNPLHGSGTSQSQSTSRTGSLSSNVTSTPYSGESFTIPPTPSEPSSRTNTMQRTRSMEDANEDRQFERIFLGLKDMHVAILRAVPVIKQQLLRYLESSPRKETELRPLWNALDHKCNQSIRLAEQLRDRLASIKLKEPGLENDVEFWQNCGALIKGFVDLAMQLRNAKGLELLSLDIIAILRPVSKIVKDTGLLIYSSPWRRLANSDKNRTPTTTINRPAYPPNGTAIVTQGLNGHGPASNTSPYVTPIPATPLTAALGPAAQATMPSSSPANRNGIGTGNATDRADSLRSGGSLSFTSNTEEPVYVYNHFASRDYYARGDYTR